jgi:hypothetical protein
VEAPSSGTCNGVVYTSSITFSVFNQCYLEHFSSNEANGYLEQSSLLKLIDAIAGA